MQTKRFLLSAIILLFCAVAGFAAEKHFPQKLAWKADKYAFEYKVEIQTQAGKTVQTLTTENSAVEVSLPAGSYRYRVTALDILENEASVSEWTAFEILVAAAPAIAPPQKEAPLSADGSTLELPVTVSSVTAGSSVELVNTVTGKVIRGVLVIPGVEAAKKNAAAGSETETASKAQFKNVPEGDWKLRVTNPSGLKSESTAFTVKDVEKERKLAEAAAAKAEKERLAAEKAAAEQAEREQKAAEKAEKERIAAEKEQLAKEKEEEEKRRAQAEKERIAAEKAAAEEAERERLLQEKAEKERIAAEKEQLAKEKAEAERLAYERTWSDNKNVQLFVGAGYSLASGGTVLADYADSTLSPAPAVRISYIPVEVSRERFGLEFSARAMRFSQSTAYYETTLTFAFAEAQLLFQHPLVYRRLYLTLKGGGGLNLVQKKLTYNGEYSGRQNPAAVVFGYPTICGGLSLFWIPARHAVVELGCDASHTLSQGMPSVMLSPALSVGLRL